jgi:hypothetical protein
VKGDKKMKVYLEDYEIDKAIQVGTGRYNMRKDSRDRSYYDNGRKQNDLLASINSAVAEIAVAKQLNQYWHGGVWLPEKHTLFAANADVGHNIEVRRIREFYNPIPVRKSDVTRERIIYGVYVKDFEYEEVDIVGYIEADYGWSIGKRPEWDRYDDNRTVAIELLNKMDS